MRKWIVILAAAVLAAAALAVVFSLSAPLLDEETEYTLTSLYCRGEEVSGQVDGDELLYLLRDASRSLLPRDGLSRTALAETAEIGLQGEEGPWHIVLSADAGVYAAYEDPDWCYAIRDGEALNQAVLALMPE